MKPDRWDPADYAENMSPEDLLREIGHLISVMDDDYEDDELLRAARSAREAIVISKGLILKLAQLERLIYDKHAALKEMNA